MPAGIYYDGYSYIYIYVCMYVCAYACIIFHWNQLEADQIVSLERPNISSNISLKLIMRKFEYQLRIISLAPA